MTIIEEIDKLFEDTEVKANPREKLYMCPRAIELLKKCRELLRDKKLIVMLLLGFILTACVPIWWVMPK